MTARLREFANKLSFSCNWLPILLLWTLLLGGCSSWLPKWFQKETSIHLTIRASEQINPDSTSETNPLFFRILQLKNIERFQEADFITLYKNTSATLGNDLIMQSAATPLFSGQTVSEVILPQAESDYLALVFFFKQYSQASTRQWIKINRNDKDCLNITVSNLLTTKTRVCP